MTAVRVSLVCPSREFDLLYSKTRANSFESATRKDAPETRALLAYSICEQALRLTRMSGADHETNIYVDLPGTRASLAGERVLRSTVEPVGLLDVAAPAVAVNSRPASGSTLSIGRSVQGFLPASPSPANDTNVCLSCFFYISVDIRVKGEHATSHRTANKPYSCCTLGMPSWNTFFLARLGPRESPGRLGAGVWLSLRQALSVDTSARSTSSSASGGRRYPPQVVTSAMMPSRTWLCGFKPMWTS